ncbi:hypothetical protein ABPG74_005593 [Tetrahymena malaccensis]
MRNNNSRSSFGMNDYYDSSNINHNTNVQKTPPKSLVNLRGGNVKLNPAQTSQSSGTLKPPKMIVESDKENYQRYGPPLSPNRAKFDVDQFSQLNSNFLDLNSMNLEQINDELDNNMNSMIILMNRRKSLIQVKRKRMLLEFDEKKELMKRMNVPQLHQELINLNSETDNQYLQNLLNNTNTAPKMQRIIQNIANDINPEAQDRKKLELSRSSDFWNTNKSFENEIDSLLTKLRFFDSELEKSNIEIQEVCKKLDTIEDNIRDLLLQKSEDHVKRAEPLFQHKQNQHNLLKQLLVQRNKIKDEKIQVIYAIIKLLSELKALRSERLGDLNGVFGIDDVDDSSTKINYYIDFVDQLENLAKIKEAMVDLENVEDELIKDIDTCSRESEAMFSEFVKKSSDEAKFFADFGDNLAKRIGMNAAIEYFLAYSNLTGIDNLDIKDILKKFKDNIVFLKPLIEEDQAIRQGLKKTSDTIDTFANILRAIENEKERRKELLRMLENCQKLKDEEEHKNELIREIELEITKKKQQKSHLEEDLENILGDADLEQYKKLGNLLKQHEHGLQQLYNSQNNIIGETNTIQKEFLRQMDQIKNDYDDIIKEILPNNIMSTLDFKNGKDIRQVKNYLKKTFKRLGITFEDQSV